MNAPDAPKADDAKTDPKVDEAAPEKPKADTKPKATADRKAAAKPKAKPQPKTPAPSVEPAGEPKAEVGPGSEGLTKVEVAGFIDAAVRVPQLKDGQPIIERGVYVVQRIAARAEDILMFRVDGDTLRVATVDGQKFELTR